MVDEFNEEPVVVTTTDWKDTQVGQAVVSFVTSFVMLFVASFPLTEIFNKDWEFWQVTLSAAAVGAARTVLAALIPQNTSFGLGSRKPTYRREAA